MAKSFGLDITDLEFWRGSLNVIRAKIDDFEQLVKQRSLPDLPVK